MIPHSRVIKQCLAASAIAWLPLLVLTLLDGHAFGPDSTKPLLTDLSVLMRFLVALPLMVYGGAVIRLRLHGVVEYLENSDMLAPTDRKRFSEAVSKHWNWYENRAVRMGAAAISLAASWVTVSAILPEVTNSWLSDGSGLISGLTAAGWWFYAVSMTLWNYLVFVRLWQFVNWWLFLARLSRLDLLLVPTHPDRCGGLGILEMGQLSFSILVASFASILAASIAESMIADSLLLVAAVPYILIFTVAAIMIVLAPLLGFVPKLVRAKREGLVTYGDLGEGLFRAFGQKWSDLNTEQQGKLLGNVDPSSLADYGYCYEVVNELRFLPLSRNGFITIGVAVILPFLPLVLVHHSAVEVLQRLLGIGG